MRNAAFACSSVTASMARSTFGLILHRAASSSWNAIVVASPAILREREAPLREQPRLRVLELLGGEAVLLHAADLFRERGLLQALRFCGA